MRHIWWFIGDNRLPPRVSLGLGARCRALFQLATLVKVLERYFERSDRHVN
jgi:hypothetical protein